MDLLRRIRWNNVARAAAVLAAVALVLAWPHLRSKPPEIPPEEPVAAVPLETAGGEAAGEESAASERPAERPAGAERPRATERRRTAERRRAAARRRAARARRPSARPRR